MKTLEVSGVICFSCGWVALGWRDTGPRQSSFPALLLLRAATNTLTLPVSGQILWLSFLGAKDESSLDSGLLIQMPLDSIWLSWFPIRKVTRPSPSEIRPDWAIGSTQDEAAIGDSLGC